MPGKIGKVRAAVVAAAALVGLAGCSGTGATGQSVDSTTNGNSASSAQYFWSPGHRQVVKDVSGPTVQGGTLNLAAYRGKWVVVNYWSSSCVPCHGEEPYFESLSKTLASKNVQFVGIDERDNMDSAKNFEQQYDVTYPSLFDAHDSYLLSFEPAVPSTTPFTIIIDPQGGIAARAADSMDYTTLRAFISRARTLTA